MKIPSPDFLRSRWFLVLGLILISYSFFVLGKMIYQNYQVNQQIKNLEKEVYSMEKENQKLSDLIAFFQTETFKEKEAREKLSMVKPGEKVLVFPGNENTENSIVEEKGTSTLSSSDEDDSQNMPTYQKWWNFFFASK